MRHWPLLFAVLVGCAPAERTPLNVFAASSLTEAFGDLEAAFEARHPDIDVRTNFAGSQTLRTQIELGAAADVYASASLADIDRLQQAHTMTAVTAFATNELVLATVRDEVVALTDLATDHRVVLGSENSPIGAYTDAFLEALSSEDGEAAQRIRQAVVSRESNVRLVLSKLRLGEADAAFVYRTDIPAGDALRVVELPGRLRPSVAYYIGNLSGSPAADSWTRHLISDDAWPLLERRGFGKPAP